jgi:uncharacterized phage protein (TIGR02220 family)
MLASANMDGIVDASLPGLADLARVTLKECEEALKVLMSPDEYSRTKTDEGRRIREVDGGWLILNHAKYRDTLKSDPLGNAENRRGKIYFIKCDNLLKIGFSKNPWARLAALKTGMSGEVNFLGCIDGTMRDEIDLQKSLEKSRFNREWYNFTPEIMALLTSKGITTGSEKVVATKTSSSTTSLQYTTPPTEAKADSDTKASSNKVEKMTQARILIHYLNEKTGRRFRETSENLEFIHARLSESGVDLDGCKKMIDRQTLRWLKTDQANYLRPQTLFNATKFDDYYSAKDLPINENHKPANSQRIDRSIGTTNEGRANEYSGLGRVAKATDPQRS